MDGGENSSTHFKESVHVHGGKHKSSDKGNNKYPLMLRFYVWQAINLLLEVFLIHVLNVDHSDSDKK